MTVGARGEGQTVNLYLMVGLVAAVVVAFVAYRVLVGPRVRCPFCREWLPRSAAYQVRQQQKQNPYCCPFCDHVILPGNLKNATS
jgi:hypothetical protein